MTPREVGAPGSAVCFGGRLRAAVDEFGALCVGIDPHPGLLAEWGLTDDADGLERFAMTCVQALAGRVAVVKPQSAFFERHGAAGIAVLERVLAALAGTSTLSILDVKRGDIGSTMDGYADAYLGVGAPLAADAVTLSPYLGFGSLDAAIRTAADAGRGRVRAGPHVQSGGWAGAAGRVGRAQHRTGDRRRGRPAQCRRRHRSATSAWSSAPRTTTSWTWPACTGRCSRPGWGAQGAGPADVAARFAGVAGIVLPAASRSVLRAGPDPAALRAAAEALRDELAGSG